MASLRDHSVAPVGTKSTRAFSSFPFSLCFRPAFYIVAKPGLASEGKDKKTLATMDSYGTLASVEDSQTLAAMSVELVSHKALAKDQIDCPDVKNHRKGNKPKSVNMADVQFSPNVLLYCEVSNNRARPLVQKICSSLWLQKA